MVVLGDFKFLMSVVPLQDPTVGPVVFLGGRFILSEAPLCRRRVVHGVRIPAPDPFNECSGSMKIATRMDPIIHCNTASGTN